ncbi:MAG: hypothetical protein GX175_01845 [Halanaerobiaceae bacterium]|nr:hypothetical protein [Halanaerobiaceae bacterium]
MAEEKRQRVRTMRYGGIKYVNNVPFEKISDFIDHLPEEKRSSMAEVTQILHDEGLISLIPDDEPGPPC